MALQGVPGTGSPLPGVPALGFPQGGPDVQPVVNLGALAWCLLRSTLHRARWSPERLYVRGQGPGLRGYTPFGRYRVARIPGYPWPKGT